MSPEKVTASEHLSHLGNTARSGQRRWTEASDDQILLPVGYQVGGWVVEATIDSSRMMAWRHI